jgi:hypothetical protein
MMAALSDTFATFGHSGRADFRFLPSGTQAGLLEAPLPPLSGDFWAKVAKLCKSPEL